MGLAKLWEIGERAKELSLVCFRKLSPLHHPESSCCSGQMDRVFSQVYSWTRIDGLCFFMTDAWCSYIVKVHGQGLPDVDPLI